MRVALWVDALQPHLSGIGRYTLELYRGLSRSADIGSLAAYGRGQILSDPERLLVGEPLPPRRGALARWQRWRQGRALATTLFHGPNYFLPPFVERGVITVHDLSVFKFPETHPAERIAQFERELGSSLARASHIITDTETVRGEIIETFGVRPEDVTAVPLGVDESFHPRSEDELTPILRKYGLAPGRYGLSVSTLEPRKKVEQLMLAWRGLPRSLRDRYPLVLVGASGWKNERLMAAIAAGEAEGWLRKLGFVPEVDLPALYAGSRLFAYPSTYEGFGFPPLEAMASGVPAMVSNRSCLPEVCGDGGLYVDPDDIAAFTSLVEQGLVDEELRRHQIAAGRARAAQFTWSRCVDRTIEVYRQVAN